jgi:aldose 1-epimerase
LTNCRALKLSSGGVTAALAPSLGGAVLSLADEKGQYLRIGTAPAVAEDPRASACFPCTPWFGRLSPYFEANGRKATLSATLPDASPLPLHGDGWITPWEVLAHTDDRLLCRYAAARAPSGFPFAYEAEQEFSVSGGGLRIELTLRNRDDAPMPAGLALHPYFKRKSMTQVAFSATRLWAPPIGEDEGRLTALPSALGAGAPAFLPDQTLDHSFTGFGGEACVVDDGGVVQLTSDAPFLHVYAPAGENFFCLEPVSHLPGLFPAIGAEGGARRLAPGETMSLKLFLRRLT